MKTTLTLPRISQDGHKDLIVDFPAYFNKENVLLKTLVSGSSRCYNSLPIRVSHQGIYLIVIKTWANVPLITGQVREGRHGIEAAEIVKGHSLCW